MSPHPRWVEWSLRSRPEISMSGRQIQRNLSFLWQALDLTPATGLLCVSAVAKQGHQHIFKLSVIMPITNGDATAGGAPLLTKQKILPHEKALEILEEYKSRDGLNIDELLDSNKNGALTYNDFLVLPGYIGNNALDSVVGDASLTHHFRLCRL